MRKIAIPTWKRWPCTNELYAAAPQNSAMALQIEDSAGLQLGKPEVPETVPWTERKVFTGGSLYL